MLAQLPNLYPSFDDKIPITRMPAESIPAPVSISVSFKHSSKSSYQVRKDSPLVSYPGEFHVPGYQYLGPGTNFTERQRLGIKPINDLDRIAMYHDKGYEDSSSTGMGMQRAVARSIHDLGAGSAMVTAALNPWSDAPLGWGLGSGTYLLAQGIARVHPYTFLPVGVLDAILL